MSELKTATDLHGDVQFIKDTYPKLFDRLCELWDAETDADVAGGFVWWDAGEGHAFWLAVCRGEWDKVKLLQPQYFEVSTVEQAIDVLREAGYSIDPLWLKKLRSEI